MRKNPSTLPDLKRSIWHLMRYTYKAQQYGLILDTLRPRYFALGLPRILYIVRILSRPDLLRLCFLS